MKFLDKTLGLEYNDMGVVYHGQEEVILLGQ